MSDADEEIAIDDLNDYRNKIEQAIIGIHQALGSMKQDLAEPILRIEHENEKTPDHFGYSEDQKEGIRVCAIRLRRELYDHFDALFDAAECANRICEAYATALHVKWAEAEFKALELSEKCARAEARLKSLEDYKEARLQEHNISLPEVRSRVMAMTGGKCAYCDQDVSDIPGDGKATMHVDHIVPKSAGGPDHICNYVPACERCNISKSAGHVLEFIQRRMTSVRVQLLDAAE